MTGENMNVEIEQRDHKLEKVSCRKLICDVFILLCLGLPILALFLAGKAYHRGFYCDDESLRHPFKESTVASIYLYIFGFGLNGAAMVILEYLRCKDNKPKILFGKEIPYWLCEVYTAFVIFCFGAGCSQFITDVLKYQVGRLRPHFYNLCLPEFDGGKTCYTSGIQLHKYITDFTCTNPEVIKSARLLKEMRLSFPSGHSSFSMYTMLHLAIYLHARLKCRDFVLAKHGLCMGVVLLSLWTGMTRVSDYKHHWSDVLAGLTLGATVAILVTRFVSTLFKPKTKTDLPASMELAHLQNNHTT